jgi:hypothetical protein
MSSSSEDSYSADESKCGGRVPWRSDKTAVVKIRDKNKQDIDTMVGIRFLDVFSQLGTHVETRFGNRDSIHDRIRTSKVNIFKEARSWAVVRSAHT